MGEGSKVGGWPQAYPWVEMSKRQRLCGEPIKAIPVAIIQLITIESIYVHYMGKDST